MKKIFIIFLILILILTTALIKNSTKKIEDEIFIVKENIRILEKELDEVKLEFEYLSSSEKLIELQNLYFENQLVKKNIQNMKIIKINSNKITLEDLKLSYE